MLTSCAANRESDGDDPGSAELGEVLDGGASTVPADASVSSQPPAECAALVDRVCGPLPAAVVLDGVPQTADQAAAGAAELCADTTACQLAKVFSRDSPGSCTEAFAAVAEFPECQVSWCDTLVTRVCGVTVPGVAGRCEDEPGCAAARVVGAERDDDACENALTDDVLFPTCGSDTDSNSPETGQSYRPPETIFEPCAALSEKFCGPPNDGVDMAPSELCAATTECQLVKVLGETAPETCSTAFSETVQFPTCEANWCDKLVVRVCGAPISGSGAPCEGKPGCAPARAVAAERDEAACENSFSDDVLFPMCAE